MATIMRCLLQIQNAIESRSDMTLVKPSSLQSILLNGSGDTSTTKPARPRPSWNRSTGQEIRQETDLELRLSSGSTFRLEVTGDVEVIADDNESAGAEDQQHQITYHQLVGRCCRQFNLVPKSSVGADKDTPQVISKYCINVTCTSVEAPEFFGYRGTTKAPEFILSHLKNMLSFLISS